MNRTGSDNDGPQDDAAAGTSRWIRCGKIAIWPSRRAVKPGERTAILTVSELAILLALVRANGEPVARATLAELCGRPQRLTRKSRTVDMMIFSLRKKIGDNNAKGGRIIVTVSSFGYAIDTGHDWAPE